MVPARGEEGAAARAGATVLHAARWLLAVILYYGGVVAIYRSWRERRFPRGELQVLRHHRVIPEADPERVYALGVRRRTFEKQARFLARHHRVVDLAEAEAFLGGRSAGAGMRILITVDDGYRDNYTEAHPVLAAHRLPAVLFVATGAIDEGRRFPWERLKRVVEDEARARLPLPDGSQIDLAGTISRHQAFRRLHRWLEDLSPTDREAVLASWEEDATVDRRNDGPLHWEEVRRLRDGGWTIGSHTVHHERLTRLPDGSLDEEMTASRRRIEAELGIPVRSFAYPSGDHDRRVVEAARRAGYDLAFTTRAGTNPPGTPALELRRKGIGVATSEMPWGGFSRALFAAEVSGILDHWLRRRVP